MHIKCARNKTAVRLFLKPLTAALFLVSVPGFAAFTGNGNGTTTVTGAVNACFLDDATGRMVCGRASIEDGIQNAIAIGKDASARPESVSVGSQAGQNTQGMGRIAIGQRAGAGSASAVPGNYTVAIGHEARYGATGTHAVGIGRLAGKNSSGFGGVAVGNGAGTNTSGDSNVALGPSAGNNVNGNRNVAIGENAGSALEGSNNVAIGANVNSGVFNAPPLQLNDTVAVGNGASTTVDNAVAIGAHSLADRGASSASSVAGVVADPSDSATQVFGVGTEAQKQAVADTVKGDLAALSVGNANATRQITNVAAGSADSDAVNVAQLKSVVSASENLGYRVDSLSGRIDEVDDRASSGIASAMAIAGLPQAYAPGKNMVSAAFANYRGESAVAVGVSAVSDSGKWVIKGSASVNRNDPSVSAGVGYQW